MARRDELLKQCKELGIEAEKSRNRIDKETGERYQESTVKDLEKAVQSFYLKKYEEEKTLSPFMHKILKLDSPMLALQQKDKKLDYIRDKLWEDNNDWIFQEKLDGCRCVLCYDVDFGWDMYSRNKSIKDCLPISYKTRLLIPDIDRNVLSQYGIKNFMIDTELLPLNKEIKPMDDGTELVADTQLNLVTSILGSLDDLSHRMQKNNPLKFVAFDLIALNGEWLTEFPLIKRDSALNGIIKVTQMAGMGNRIEKVQSTKINKKEFYERILSVGGEGVVVKDINSKYDLLGKRAGEWIKIKRTVSQSLLMEKMGDTIDAFITGFTEGTPGTANEGLVGALEFSIYLTDDNDEYIEDERGNPIAHHIATVSGITQDLRQAISTKDEFGRVALNPNMYGKVATIDGQDISSRNYRFAHATFQGWRPDRSIDTCKMRKSFLERLVL